VILNFSEEPAPFTLPAGVSVNTRKLLIGNYPVKATEDIRQLTLRPYEARVYRLG
jgi:oligo-1,6-glucosidase